MQRFTLATLAIVLAAGTALAGPGLVLPASETGPMTINLVQGYSFDPCQGLPELPANLASERAEGEFGYYLVQFVGDIRPEWKLAVERLGGQFLWYVPRYTFVVRLPNAQVSEVTALPAVRWVGLDQPAFKLFPGLQNRDGRQTLIVVFHYAEDGHALVEQLKSFGACNILPEFNAWNKSVKLDVDASRIPDIARLPGVYWIEPYGDITPDNGDVTWVDQHGYAGVADTSRPIWRRNVTGRHVLVGLTDQQLWHGHDLFRDTVNNTPGPDHRKVVRYVGTQGSAAHGTHTAGTLCGNDEPVGGTSTRDGMAKDARLVFQYYSQLPTNWDMNVWFARPDSGLNIAVDSLRALNHSMSLSRKDTYNIYIFTDMTADQFIWGHRKFMHCNSMGNLTTNQMGHPVIAKSIISTGGTQNGTLCQNLYTSESRGPTSDGRRKPQLISPAENVYSASNTSANGYVSMSGTSMATPNMTGSTALIRDYFRQGYYPTGDTLTGTRREISAALNKAVAIVGADNSISGYTVPDNNIGWGRIDLDSSLYFAGDPSRLWVTDDTIGLQTGDSVLYSIPVVGDSRPFRVTLCWTDYPGTMRAALILVNNLDLTVISPTGTEYKGSVYSGGQSQTGGIYDTLNPEECFRRNSPELGNWTIKVKARNIPQGPQPFALAAIGQFEFAPPPTHDVGVVQIVAPADTIDQGTVVMPRVIYRNYGTADEQLLVALGIGPVYTRWESLFLTAGESDTVDFPDWTADSVGQTLASTWITLPGDENPGNDTLVQFFYVAPVTGVNEEAALPGRFVMDNPRPNPFSGSTAIRYGLPAAAVVGAAIYSSNGRLVRRLARGEQVAGYHTLSWNGRDESGRSLSRGVYILRLEAGTARAIRKLILE